MTIQVIPLTPVAAQSFTIQLNSQNCAINIYQKSTGLYFDLAIDGNPIVTTMICLNLVGLVRESYMGFNGQLAFVDTQGTDDPDYTGLGSRYQLVYQS
jgi:hypothetical protein